MFVRQLSHSRALLAMMCLVPVMVIANLSPGLAQSSDSNATLLARQQTRLNNMEDSLKDVRGHLSGYLPYYSSAFVGAPIGSHLNLMIVPSQAIDWLSPSPAQDTSLQGERVSEKAGAQT